jgi:NitT/TauT family transport system substrate-binding protein
MRALIEVPTGLRGVVALAALWSILACGGGGGVAQPAAPAASGGPAASNAPAGSGGAAAAGAPGASSAPAVVPPLSPTVHVKIGLPLIIADAGVYIAIERGYFAAEGLEVELIPASGGQQLVPALATNQVQFGSGAFDTAVLNAAARDLKLKVLSDKSRFRASSATAAVMARADLFESGALTDVRQLRGKNVAVLVRNGTPDYYLEIALKKVGMTLDDLVFTTMAITDTPAAFANKAIDAAWLYEPMIAAVEMAGLARVVMDAGEIAPDEYPQVLYASEQFIQENPEAVRRFVTAHLRGQRDYYRAFVTNETDRGEIISYLAKYTAVKDTAIYERMRYHAVEPNGYLDPRPLERFQEFSMDKGLLPRRLDVAGMIDPQFIQYAVQRLGAWPDPYR